MVKKIHSAATGNGRSAKAKPSAAKPAGMPASQLAGAVKDSAQHIWLAGMGAFSKAQEEGTKVFEALVKEGQNLQRKTQAVAEEKIGEVAGKMTAMADTVTHKAGQNWDKLEGIFEARTAKALGKLGVPTAKDVAALTERVDALAAAVAKLARQGAAGNGAAKPARTAARKATGKAAVKTAVKTGATPARLAVRKTAKTGAAA
jgi:poly(hydroxyalkanoate) granule-associated protein